MGVFGHTLKRARRLSVRPLVELHLTKADFSPAAFHKDLKNNKHILSYDPTKLFSYGFINPKGSTLNWGLAFRTLVMCGTGTLISIIVSAEGLIFASLVSFLLGLFISTTFTRWWSVREKLGIVMNNITTLSMFLNNYAPRDDDAVAVSKKIIRLLHLGHALIYKQANDDHDFSDLMSSSIITRAEAEALEEFKDLNLPPIVYSWVMALIQPFLMKLQPVSCIAPMLGCITGSINASQEISALLKTQMPYMYLHLLAMTTKIHLALIIFYSGGMISQGITDHLWTRIFLGYTIIITNNIIYEGLLRVHEMLYNPLGDDNADFPTHLYITTTIALGIEAALNTLPPQDEQLEEQQQQEQQQQQRIEEGDRGISIVIKD